MKRRRRKSPRRPGFTISQFAREVDQTPTGIRNAVRNGEIRAVPYNNVLVIPPSELDRYLAIWGSAVRSAPVMRDPPARPASAQHQIKDSGPEAA